MTRFHDRDLDADKFSSDRERRNQASHYRHELDPLIGILQGARDSAIFSMGTLPVKPLLDCLSDLSLLVSQIYESGGQIHLNQGIRFDDNGPPNELGNSRSMKVGKSAQIVYNPEVALILKHLAQWFILVKKGEGSVDNFRQSMASTLITPYVFVSGEFMGTKQEKPRKGAKFKKDKSRFYHRRLREKRRGGTKHGQ
jgi:hypothetical protein